LTEQAEALPPGAEGVLCIDWMNGCRTPLMDGSLSGSFTGLKLNHGPHHLYRALLEASAYGLRWIVELLDSHHVPVERLVATGGLPHHNPLLVQVYADVLGKPITVHPSKQGPALGAAILGVLAAGRESSGFSTPAAAIRAMAAPRKGIAGREAKIVRPDRKRHRQYSEFYNRYRKLAEWFNNSAAK
jgi:L-ribulokinase